jgi:histidinol-phosphate aminotransferase
MSRYFQPHIDRMAGYVPGEQPRAGGFIKLNTNENPYPPSPRVLEAIRQAVGDRLRLYPDPLGTAFREVAARLHGVEPAMVLAGNGSDDLLTIITRAFAGPGDILLAPSPSYILYRTLAELQNAVLVEVPFEADWSLDPDRFAHPQAKLAFLPSPNSPSGTTLPPDAVAELARRLPCPLVVDEAYADFAATDCVALVNDHPNLIITRSLSKGYSLAGLRFGYALAQPAIIEGLIKVKDSYNCDTLSLIGASAALEDQAYHAETTRKVLATRRRLTEALRGLGYPVPDSQANFVWCPGGPPAGAVYESLKARKILVRLMRYAGHPDGIRISVGTDAEIDQLLAALRLGWGEGFSAENTEDTESQIKH